jgi:hypothetical protein
MQPEEDFHGHPGVFQRSMIGAGTAKPDIGQNRIESGSSSDPPPVLLHGTEEIVSLERMPGSGKF